MKKPTRTTESTNTLQDLILVSDYSKVKDANAMDFEIADRKFINVVYDLIPKKQKPLILKSQSFKNTNIDQPTQDIEDFPWWICSTFDDINDTTWAWEHSFKNIVNSHMIPYAPLRHVKVERNSLIWVNRDIRKEMNVRVKLLKSWTGSQSSIHLLI